MGICRLWEALNSVAERSQTLPELTLIEGFMRQPALGGLNLGIDTSIWIERFSQSTFTHRARYSSSPELYAAFRRFCGVLSTCALPVFVFDGPNRPPVKRGKQVLRQADWMVDDLQRMITAFGFRYHMAPGEAEAELALMNELGIIDAVLTDDSDIFVFGARTVIRNITYEDNTSILSLYRADKIKAYSGLGLDRGGFLVVALLAGGDYHQVGLKGCGSATAIGVARYGLGTELLSAARILQNEELQVFLDGWRIQLRHYLKNDPLGYVGTRHPALARAITDEFPPLDALHYYARPVVSDFPAFFQLPIPGPPDIRVLTRFCELENLFGGYDGIVAKFRELLWPGLVLRELLARAFAYVNDRPPLPPSNLFNIEVMPARGTGKMSKLRVSSQALEHLVMHALYGVRDPDLGERLLVKGRDLNKKTKRFVHVPSVVLRKANAGMFRNPAAIAATPYEDVDPPSNVEFVPSSSHEIIDLTEDA